MPIILELCCGWKSISTVFVSEHHWQSATLDVLPKFKPTILADMTQWDYRSYFEEAVRDREHVRHRVQVVGEVSIGDEGEESVEDLVRLRHVLVLPRVHTTTRFHQV